MTFLVHGGEGFVERLPQGARYRSPTAPEIELDIDDLWAAVDRKFAKPQATARRR